MVANLFILRVCGWVAGGGGGGGLEGVESYNLAAMAG